jgi:hypothetical protein
MLVDAGNGVVHALVSPNDPFHPESKAWRSGISPPANLFIPAHRGKPPDTGRWLRRLVQATLSP